MKTYTEEQLYLPQILSTPISAENEAAGVFDNSLIISTTAGEELLRISSSGEIIMRSLDAAQVFVDRVQNYINTLKINT